MKEYHDLVRYVLDHGVRQSSRTGIDTLSVFSYHYHIDLQKGFPLLTTKKIMWKSVLHEVLWYLSGEDHIRNLRKHTKIWDAWADEDGNLETAYGRYWRRFPSAIEDGKGGWVVKEIDQIQYVIDTLKTQPHSRRMVVVAWEPGNAETSKLPPCHFTFAFNVKAGRLNCHLTQRSGDVALGIPFNIAAYSLLTHMIAKEVGLEVGEFSHTVVDCHIYVADPDSEMAEYDHRKGLEEQLKRPFKPLPQLKIADKPMNELQFEDFELIGYECDSYIPFKVAV